MRNKPYRKGDRLIESLASGVVVFDLNKFIVSSSVTQFSCGYVRVPGDHTLHIMVSNKSDEKGSSICASSLFAADPIVSDLGQLEYKRKLQPVHGVSVGAGVPG